MRLVAKARHYLSGYLDVLSRRKADEDNEYLVDIREYPIIVEDVFGIKVIRYPWGVQSVTELTTREANREEFEAFSKLISPGDLVFDIGANVGRHSVFFSHLVGTTGQVMAFEPVPATFQFLQETLVINHCHNVHTFCVGMLDYAGRNHMHCFPIAFNSWNSFGEPIMQYKSQVLRPAESITVECDILDYFCQEHDIEKIDFVKIDVEGFEKQVLRGAHNMLSARNIRFLSFEVSQATLEGSRVESKEIFQLLDDYGYRVYRFDFPSKSFVGPIMASNEYHQNYYASREDLGALCVMFDYEIRPR